MKNSVKANQSGGSFSVAPEPDGKFHNTDQLQGVGLPPTPQIPLYEALLVRPSNLDEVEPAFNPQPGSQNENCPPCPPCAAPVAPPAPKAELPKEEKKEAAPKDPEAKEIVKELKEDAKEEAADEKKDEESEKKPKIEYPSVEAVLSEQQYPMITAVLNGTVRS